MKIAIPKEIIETEARVALVPHLVQELQKCGCSILMEKGAGQGAHYLDEAYSGVTFYDNAAKLYGEADIILKVAPPTPAEVNNFKEGTILIGFLSPLRNREMVQALQARHITSFAVEYLPRISRAQAMDALSSQATVAGYKAVLIAANELQRFFPMLTTAAGTIRPATVLVIGAGVAGLQAIATAKRLGAIVHAYDIRAAAREQVESLGAKMIQIDVKAEGAGGYARELTNEEKQKQQEALFNAIAKAEAVITTALIPDKPAPKIINRAMVEAMAPGSVIVDLAAVNGGNCELTQPNQTIRHQDVIIAGPTNLPSLVARDASNMYSRNLIHFLNLFIKEGKITLDWQDPILAESVLTFDGAIKHVATRELIEGGKH